MSVRYAVSQFFDRVDVARRVRRFSKFSGVSERVAAKWVEEWRYQNRQLKPDDMELYLLVRATQPRTVLETGVNRGWSSTAILRGLHDNGYGHLNSIDLPTHDPAGRVNLDGVVEKVYIPYGYTGCEVPQFLRARWTLHEGDSHTLLPLFPSPDLFFHDSDHSYAHQAWEYRTVLETMGRRSVLASDDVTWSPAFREVSKDRTSLIWTHDAQNRGAMWT